MFEVYDRFVYTPDWFLDLFKGFISQYQDEITVLDIGASIGDFSIWITNTIPRAKVYSLEGCSSAFKLLQSNLRLNQKTENIFPINKALNCGRGKINRDIKNTPAVSLVELISELKHIHLLKLDIEGMEFENILNTPSEHLRNIDFITMELHKPPQDTDSLRLCEHLKKAGFCTRTSFTNKSAKTGYLYAFRQYSSEE